jgi:hypothetical protein
MHLDRGRRPCIWCVDEIFTLHAKRWFTASEKNHRFMQEPHANKTKTKNEEKDIILPSCNLREESKTDLGISFFCWELKPK